MRISRYIIPVIGSLLCLVLGYWLGRRAVKITETIRIDSLFYEKPLPVNVTRSFARVSVPVLLFAPADTVRETVVVSIGQDSTRLQLAIEHKQYRDSTYYAEVSGPAVGGYSPRLDHIETYSKTVTRTVTVRDPYRWEIGPAVGAWYGNQHTGFWIGGYVRRSYGRISLSAAGGLNPQHGAAFVQISGGVILWRK